LIKYLLRRSKFQVSQEISHFGIAMNKLHICKYAIDNIEFRKAGKIGFFFFAIYRNKLYLFYTLLFRIVHVETTAARHGLSSARGGRTKGIYDVHLSSHYLPYFLPVSFSRFLYLFRGIIPSLFFFYALSFHLIILFKERTFINCLHSNYTVI
ncbi:Odorant receptor 426, partial [Nylanderia fulva]